jgi:ADP-ribose pyrophosphatase YjhB (NUDIX family)
LQVKVGEVAAVLENIVRDGDGRIRYHYVIIDYYAQPVGGSLLPGTDVSDARWFSRDDLDRLDITEKAGQLARELLTRSARVENAPDSA